MSKIVDYNAFNKMNARKQAKTLTSLMLEGRHDEAQLLVKGLKQVSTINEGLHSTVKSQKENRKVSNEKAHTSASNLYKKDFCIADKFQYIYSPNTDGDRNVNEVLAGTGSNLFGGKRKKRK